MVGLGYYWAINRDYDVTYRFQDFTTHAFTHHVDFRGKPRVGTDFDFILYGVQDRGQPQPDNPPPPTYSGINIYAVGRSELGNGWTARGNVNYISSFRFRQQWSESYTEAINSEIHSMGSIGKNWKNYTFDRDRAPAEFQSQRNPGHRSAHRKQPFRSQRRQPSASCRKRSSTAATARSRAGAALVLVRFGGRPALQVGADVRRQHAGLPLPDEPVHQPRQPGAALTSAFHLGGFNRCRASGSWRPRMAKRRDRVDRLEPCGGDNLVRSARDFSVDFVFPSLARIFDKKTVFGDKLKHVIEPRAVYRYVPASGRTSTVSSGSTSGTCCRIPTS